MLSQNEAGKIQLRGTEAEWNKKGDFVANSTYDIITVGGGLGGSALGKAMAAQGAKVLVLEREKQFKDRIRGEFMAPWGVAEARELGIDELLRTTCGHDLPYVDLYAGPLQAEHRDLQTTTPQGLYLYCVCITQPCKKWCSRLQQMQGLKYAEVLSYAMSARDRLPTVMVEQDGQVEEVRARLVVGVDGRGSLVRKWTGFPVHQDSEHLLISGVMLENMPLPPEDTNYLMFNLTLGQEALLFPQGHGRVRAYFVCRTGGLARLQGAADVPRFVAECVRAGAPAEWYAGVRAIGPLATFDGAATWVDTPISRTEWHWSAMPPGRRTRRGDKGSLSRCETCECCATTCAGPRTGRQLGTRTPRNVTATSALFTRWITG